MSLGEILDKKLTREVSGKRRAAREKQLIYGNGKKQGRCERMISKHARKIVATYSAASNHYASENASPPRHIVHATPQIVRES